MSTPRISLMIVTLIHRLRPENLASADYSQPEYASSQVTGEGPDHATARSAALTQVPEDHMVIVEYVDR